MTKLAQYEGRSSSQQEAYADLQKQAGDKARLVGDITYTVTVDKEHAYTDKSFETAYLKALQSAGFVAERFDPTEHTLEVVAAAKFKGQGAGAAKSFSRNSDLTDKLF